MSAEQKTLVAYFSCGGVTRKLAERLAEATKGELFEIKPEVPYTNADLDWQNPNSRSSEEMNDKSSRPAVSSVVAKMARYDVVFVGFPIWWYVAPTIINTFLESYDFSGKTVVPFATSGMSEVGETDRWLRGSCSKETNWRPAKRFPSFADVATLRAWVDGLNLAR